MGHEVCAVCSDPHDKNLVYDHRFLPNADNQLRHEMCCKHCFDEGHQKAMSEIAAADAGPRQPDKIEYRCAHCGEPMTQGLSDDTVIHFEWCACVTAPPVPQEAAPRLPSGLSKGAGYKTLGAFPVPCATNSSEEATAPDWAMRVAREIYEAQCDHGYLRSLDAVAALIRQAGSEREREIEHLKDMLRCDPEETIEDGFGSRWSRTCPTCGLGTMHINRPGEVQCDYCS